MTSERLGRERLLRGGLTALIGNLVSKLLTLTVGIIIVRSMSVTRFGQFSFAVAYGTFAALFADLGVDVVTTRELAAAAPEDEGRILGSAAALKAAVVGATLALALAGSFLYPASARVGALIASGTVVGGVAGTLSLNLSSRVRLLGMTIVQALVGAATAVALVVALRAGAGVVPLISIQTVGSIAVSAAPLALARRHARSRLHFDRSTAAAIGRGATPLGIAIACTVVYRRVDQLLLPRLSTVQQLGHYAASVSIVESFNLVPAAMATVALPALSQRYRGQRLPATPDRISGVGYRYLAALILPLAALGTARGGAVLELVYGPAYRGGAATLAVLLWAQSFAFLGVLMTQVLITRHQVRPLAGLLAIAAMSNVIVNVLTIPRFGQLGAAWASLVAYSFPLVGALCVRDISDVARACLRAAWRPGVAAVLVCCVLAAVPATGVGLVALFLAVWAAALLVTRSLTVSEISTVGRALLRPDPGVRPGEVAL